MDLIATVYAVWSQTDGLELILAAVAGLFAWLLIKRGLRVLFSARARRHRRKRRQADRVLKTINSFDPGPALGYLRKIDPFVFELVVLAAFKAVGCKVIYNKRFTGDGGIDGQVKIGQHWYLIQSKRYGLLFPSYNMQCQKAQGVVRTYGQQWADVQSRSARRGQSINND